MRRFLLAGTAVLGLTASGFAAYGTPIDFTYTGSLVDFTVPATGSYQILAFGASGGGFLVGRGAEIGGTFSLTAGEDLTIAVGGAGTLGGGGGSFVVGPSNTPLVIAGGGGGPGFRMHFGLTPGGGGLTGEAGGLGLDMGGGAGGIGGNGGAAGSEIGNGGGGGFLAPVAAAAAVVVRSRILQEAHPMAASAGAALAVVVEEATAAAVVAPSMRARTRSWCPVSKAAEPATARS